MVSGGNGGEVSVLALEKLQQTLRQREEEVAHLQDRLQDVREPVRPRPLPWWSRSRALLLLLLSLG